jgi:hypothetical protein
MGPIIGLGAYLQSRRAYFHATALFAHPRIYPGHRSFFVFRRNARAVGNQPAYILFNGPLWPFTGDTK